MRDPVELGGRAAGLVRRRWGKEAPTHSAETRVGCVERSGGSGAPQYPTYAWGAFASCCPDASHRLLASVLADRVHLTALVCACRT